MVTNILNGFKELENHETENGNSVVDHFGRGHVFQISTLESFNQERKYIYNSQTNVVDGDIICHKKWFEYDNFLQEAFVKQFDAEGYEDEQRINEEAYRDFKIDWDHRFYVIVRSYDGKNYAVNVHPDFYGDLICENQNISYEKNGNIAQTIIPIEELPDDYVFALSNSFIMERFIHSSNYIVSECTSIVSPEVDAKLYEIRTGELIGLRTIAFIDSLIKNGYENIVFSIKGSKYRRDNIEMILWHTSSDNSKYKFVGHYSGEFSGIIMCRSEVAHKYERNGFLLIDFDKMLHGEYVNNDIFKDNEYTRCRHEKH